MYTGQTLPKKTLLKQSLNIKIEKEDLEKQVNNYRSKLFKAISFFILTTGFLFSQDEYRKGDTYSIDTITVVGLKNFSDRTVVTYTGLRQRLAQY
jgi:hypothetical protein